jgi:hypothetical protein
VKARYLESHTSFYKLSLKIYYKKKNPNLSYGELKFERWVSKLLLLLNKWLNNKKPKFKVHKKNLIIKIFSKSPLWYQCYHIILPLSRLFIKNIYIKVHGVIMYCYRFLGTLLKVHYVMVIKKLSMNFIQYDYITYNIVVLSPFSF